VGAVILQDLKKLKQKAVLRIHWNIFPVLSSFGSQHSDILRKGSRGSKLPYPEQREEEDGMIWITTRNKGLTKYVLTYILKKSRSQYTFQTKTVAANEPCAYASFFIEVDFITYITFVSYRFQFNYS
jgi:hypothetical protein